LVTLDDPGDAPEEDTFHLQAKNTLDYWLGQQQFPAGCQLDQRTEGVSDSDAYKVTFGQGDWTCTMSRLTGTTNVSMEGMNGNLVEPPTRKFDIDVCTITHFKNGEIVERKMFYDLAGMQNQFGVM
jgi:SnoaL-like polyketide cyclase